MVGPSVVVSFSAINIVHLFIFVSCHDFFITSDDFFMIKIKCLVVIRVDEFVQHFGVTGKRIDVGDINTAGFFRGIVSAH
jgi:hypothetical protein